MQRGLDTHIRGSMLLVYTWVEGGVQQGIYFRVDRRLLEEFTRAAERMGLSRSEALRVAMRMFVERSGVTRTAQMRGLVQGSRLSSRELEEAYLVSR